MQKDPAATASASTVDEAMPAATQQGPPYYAAGGPVTMHAQEVEDSLRRWERNTQAPSATGMTDGAAAGGEYIAAASSPPVVQHRSNGGPLGYGFPQPNELALFGSGTPAASTSSAAAQPVSPRVAHPAFSPSALSAASSPRSIGPAGAGHAAGMSGWGLIGGTSAAGSNSSLHEGGALRRSSSGLKSVRFSSEADQ